MIYSLVLLLCSSMMLMEKLITHSSSLLKPQTLLVMLSVQFVLGMVWNLSCFDEHALHLKIYKYGNNMNVIATFDWLWQ